MPKTITITINNVNPAILDPVFEDYAKRVWRMFGIDVPETDHIELDFETILAANYETLKELFGSVYTAQTLQLIEECKIK